MLLGIIEMNVRTFDLLTPRIVVKTELDGSSALIVPEGGKVELYSNETTNRFRVAGLAKPPIAIVGVPNVATQYITGSVFEVKNAGDGSGSLMSSEIVGGPLPYKQRVTS